MGFTHPGPAPCRLSESPLHRPDKHSLILCLHTSRDGTLTPLQNWTVAWGSVLWVQLKPAPLVLSCLYSKCHHSYFLPQPSPLPTSPFTFYSNNPEPLLVASTHRALLPFCAHARAISYVGKGFPSSFLLTHLRLLLTDPLV